MLHKNSRAFINNTDPNPPPTPPPNPPQPPEEGGMNGWVIALLVLVGVAILAVVGYLVVKARKGRLAGSLDEAGTNGSLIDGAKHNNV